MTTPLIRHLESFVTDRRKELFERILEQRTRYITVALEDIYQAQNASAVLRTCDCFGIQDIHIIENSNPYDINPDVTLGSDKWLSLHKYNKDRNNSLVAMGKLRSDGYRIIATTPHKPSVALQDFDLSAGRIALFFGTELTGLTEEILSASDENLHIPLRGFTESFNISVSAAIILHHFTEKLRTDNIPWALSEEEKSLIKLNWLRQSVRNSEIIEKDFLSRQPEN